jgi:hypothetical protein
MFTNQIDVRDEIIKLLFSDNELDNPLDNIPDYCPLDNPLELSEPSIMDTDDDFDEVSQEEINKNNSKIIELFLDEDFTYLLKICLNKPELLNKVTSYITNGNISFEIKDINKEDFKYQKEYQELQELLNKVNIDINNEILLMSVLQHFEGNLNLALRLIINS